MVWAAVTNLDTTESCGLILHEVYARRLQLSRTNCITGVRTPGQGRRWRPQRPASLAGLAIIAAVRVWAIPEGLSVASDGTWRVGDLPVVHEATLGWLKRHLVFEDGGAFVSDGNQRLPVRVDGPPFVVTRLRLDAVSGSATACLDDGSEEPIHDHALRLDAATGACDCAVRGGRTRARLSRAAHQQLLEAVDEQGQGFVLCVGPRRVALRT